MKVPQSLKTNTAQHTFEAALVIVLLLILPQLGKNSGAIAMVVASVIGLLAYLGLYGDRLRSRRQLKTVALAVALGFALGTAGATALWLIRLR
jgi:hypothetical protein